MQEIIFITQSELCYDYFSFPERITKDSECFGDKNLGLLVPFFTEDSMPYNL